LSPYHTGSFKLVTCKQTNRQKLPFVSDAMFWEMLTANGCNVSALSGSSQQTAFSLTEAVDGIGSGLSGHR